MHELEEEIVALNDVIKEMEQQERIKAVEHKNELIDVEKALQHKVIEFDDLQSKFKAISIKCMD